MAKAQFAILFHTGHGLKMSTAPLRTKFLIVPSSPALERGLGSTRAGNWCGGTVRRSDSDLH